MFYGLLWVPNKTLLIQEQELGLKQAQIQIENLKVQRTCDAAAKTELANVLARAKKDDKKLSQEEQNKIYLVSYNNCVFLQGMDYLMVRPQAQPAVKNAQPVKKENKK